MNTYAKCAANPRGMRTSKIIGLKVSWNEHLQKTGGESYCYPALRSVAAVARSLYDTADYDLESSWRSYAE